MLRTALMLGLALTAPAYAGDHKPGHKAESAQPVKFTVRVENISQGEALKTSNGSAPFVLAPGLWAVHTKNAPLFTPGEKDSGSGLEALAEDGDPAQLATSLQGRKGVTAKGVFNTPVGASEPGPLTPGAAYEFTVTAAPGARLSIAEMFGQSNDLFYSTGVHGVDLFDAEGNPISGDVTSTFVLWDAGTEVNQEPGLGPDQAPRQSGPNSGPAERKRVAIVKDGFSYPETTSVMRITVTPER